MSQRGNYSIHAVLYYLGCFMEMHGGLVAELTKTETEELFISVRVQDAVIEYYVDLALFCGLGSSLIVQPQ